MRKLNNPNFKQLGFSMIEMVVVLAILSILLMMMIPSAVDRVIKEQIIASMPLTDIAKEPIGLVWRTTETMPADNAEVELPEPQKIVNNLVTSVEVDNGAIHITYGNHAHVQLKDKVLTLRPAVISDSPVVPITWVCGRSSAPNNMTLMGTDRTNIADEFLPNLCK